MARRKFIIGEQVIGNDRKASYRGRRGVVIKYESAGQYWIIFEDSRKECVDSGWLNKQSYDP